jgi:hypothetical protein
VSYKIKSPKNIDVLMVSVQYGYKNCSSYFVLSCLNIHVNSKKQRRKRKPKQLKSWSLFFSLGPLHEGAPLSWSIFLLFRSFGHVHTLSKAWVLLWLWIGSLESSLAKYFHVRQNIQAPFSLTFYVFDHGNPGTGRYKLIGHDRWILKLELFFDSCQPWTVFSTHLWL